VIRDEIGDESTDESRHEGEDRDEHVEPNILRRHEGVEVGIPINHLVGSVVGADSGA